ncbi:MAG TPA: molybdopterin molybdotransferase MoeA [Clostridia bacterium]|nr:molybdopterin molybdotransferase MoeA [Clostridia bacterium]
MNLLYGVDSPALAWLKLREHLINRVCPIEELGIMQALGYVLAEDCFAKEDLPYFDCSLVDGYALKATDSFGVSKSSSNYLKLLDRVEIGAKFDSVLLLGTAVAVTAGSALPRGADTVIRLEDTNLLDENTIQVNRSVSPGENVLTVGEDYRKGDLILSKGRKLRAQDIGVLVALGYSELKVFSKPKVAIISIGDELVPPQKKAEMGRIRDVNSYLLSSLVHEAGGLPLRLGIFPDSLEKLTAAIEQGLKIADLVLISGGRRDHTVTAINKLGNPGVFVHGLALKPGKSTAIGLINDKTVFVLPGQPVSVFVAFELLIRPLLQSFTTLPQEIVFGQGRPRIKARLNCHLSSTTGWEEYVQVRLENTLEGIIAHPILDRSRHISAFPLADGFIGIPANTERLEAGEIVEVIVYP